MMSKRSSTPHYTVAGEQTTLAETPETACDEQADIGL